MSENETNKLVKGALLLTLASLISKVLSAGYRIPLQNLTGDFGFYIYQQIYPILGMILILSLYGFPSAIAKLIVEQKESGKSVSLKSFYLPIFIIMFFINGLIALFLYLNAYSISTWIGDPNLKGAYELVALAFLFIPFTALLRGVFQGNYKMNPIAYSQVGEQLIRVTIIILVAYLFVNNKVDVYSIGKGAAYASIAGAMIALLILFIFFMKEKPFTLQKHSIPWYSYLKAIVLLGMVASLNHMVLLIIQFADVFTLVPRLTDYGLSTVEAMKAKGVFDRGQPLIQLGTVLGSSFALALIPAVSQKRLREAPEQFYPYIRGGLLFSFYLAAGASIGLITIFPEVNTLLFQNTKGTTSLQILSLAILLSSVSITTTSILQGLGYFKRTALFIIVAFFIKWIANQMFVPVWGIVGSSIATVLSLLVLTIVVFYEMNRKIPKLKILKRVNLAAFIIACLGMFSYLLAIQSIVDYQLITSRFSLLLYVLFISSSGAFIYLVLLLRARAFTKEELSMLPYSHLFIKIHKGRDTFEE